METLALRDSGTGCLSEFCEGLADVYRKRGLLTISRMIGTLTAFQWLIYDSFKVGLGLPTTGGH